LFSFSPILSRSLHGPFVHNGKEIREEKGQTKENCDVAVSFEACQSAQIYHFPFGRGWLKAALSFGGCEVDVERASNRRDNLIA
jgi:hypothetical protein